MKAVHENSQIIFLLLVLVWQRSLGTHHGQHKSDQKQPTMTKENTVSLSISIEWTVHSCQLFSYHQRSEFYLYTLSNLTQQDVLTDDFPMKKEDLLTIRFHPFFLHSFSYLARSVGHLQPSCRVHLLSTHLAQSAHGGSSNAFISCCPTCRIPCSLSHEGCIYLLDPSCWVPKRTWIKRETTCPRFQENGGWTTRSVQAVFDFTRGCFPFFCCCTKWPLFIHAPLKSNRAPKRGEVL